MIHWNIWTDANGVRHEAQRDSWQIAFQFMDALVATTNPDGTPRYRQVCYQRLPEGVAPTA